MNMTLQQRLEAAEKAYHDLVLGAAVREVRDSNGEMIVYTAANRDALRGYIAILKDQIAASGGTPSRTGPLRFVF
jgi:hypothetical protein